MSATLDLKQIGRVMFQEVAQKIMTAPHFIVALFDTTNKTIYCSFAIVDGEEMDPAVFPPIPLGDGPMSQAIISQVAFLDFISPSSFEFDDYSLPASRRSSCRASERCRRGMPGMSATRRYPDSACSRSPDAARAAAISSRARDR